MSLLHVSSLAAVLVVSLAACGEDEPDVAPDTTAAQSVAPTTAADGTAPASTTAATPATIAAPTTTVDLATGVADRVFVSTAVEGYPLVDGTEIVLTFEGDRISASGGCNQLGSTWTLDGDVLVVPDMAMTQMACEPAALMDQDTWIAALLTSSPTATLEGDTLTLSADGAVVTFTDQETVNPDRPLEGTDWTLDGVRTADAVSSVPAGGAVPTLRFEGGQAVVTTGCNTGSTGYEVGDGEITFQPMALTLAACVDPAMAAVEQAIVATLSGTVAYEIDADVLTLTNGDQGLIYRAPPG
jgi:heat shock protein HslJ